jgi:hypothetical protein
MQFGFNLPLSGPSASPAMLARRAAEGEAIGDDYAAISDHIVEPIDIHARYPWSWRPDRRSRSAARGARRVSPRGARRSPNTRRLGTSASRCMTGASTANNNAPAWASVVLPCSPTGRPSLGASAVAQSHVPRS